MIRAMLNPRPLLTSLLALSFLASTAGCSGQSSKASHLSRANRYFEKQQYEQARLEYINVLKIDPNEKQALNRLGSILYDAGQTPQAFAVLRKAQEVDPGNADTRLKLARIYIGAGQIEQARQQSIAILDKDPGNESALLIATDAVVTPDQFNDVEQRVKNLAKTGDKAAVHLALANLAMRRNDLKTADAEIALARSMNPKSSLANLVLGNLRWRQGQLSDAENAFKAASELAPEDWLVRLRWADFQLNQGHFEQAKQIAGQITRKHPNHVPALLALSRVAFAEKKLDESAGLLKRAQSISPGDVETSLLSAQVSFAKGDAKGALAELERLRDQYPKVAQIHYQLALGYLRAQALPKATSSLETAISLDPNFDAAILLLGELEIRRGDFANAVRLLSGYVQRAPKVPQAHALLVEAYRGQGQLDDAFAACQKWKDLAPSIPQPLYMAGIVLRQQRKEAEARVEFEKALQVAPGFLAAADQLTELDLKDKKGDQAVKRAELLVQANPKAVAPLLLLARIHIAQRTPDKAEPILTKALELEPDSSAASMLLAQVYIGSNRRDEALRKLRAVVEKNPRNATALLQIAMIEQESKEYANARQSYEKVLTLNPKLAAALNNLAYMCAENLNDLDAAYQHAKAARDLAPDDPSVADTLGWVLCKRGEHAWALSLLGEAASKRPSTPEVQFHLGTVHYLMGNESQAEAAFRRALESANEFPSKAEAQRRLALLQINPASPSPADTALLKEALAKDPKDTIALLRSASIAEHQGSLDQALAYLRKAVEISPKSTGLLMRLGHFYASRLNDPQKALEQGKLARDLAPQDPAIAHDVGQFALAARDYARAHSLLQESDEKHPNDPQILFDRALAEYYRGRIADAERTMKRALQVNASFPRADQARRFLELISLSRDPAPDSSSQAKVRQVLEKEPDYVPALMADALLNERAGQVPEAKRIYEERILKLIPDFAPAWRQLAFLYARQSGADDRAFEAGMKARQVLSEDPELARLLGEVAFRRKDYSRAAQFLDQSARKQAPDAELLYRLGVAYQQLKQKDQSKAALQRALTLNPPVALAADINRALAQLK